MRIFIDIGHPAHVHYFRNFIKIMQDKGHEFFVTARDRSIIHYLLEYYQIPYYNRGRGKNGVFGKLLYMLLADYRLLIKSKKFKPDIFISFASPYAAQVSWFLKKLHIALDDTEHAKFSHLFYKPFSDVLLNPDCFQKDFEQKQIRFKGFIESCYLHPNYFHCDESIYKELDLKHGERLVLLRFISWKANHDIGHSGLDVFTKKNIVNILTNKGYRVLISTESINEDPFFEPYIIKIAPEKIHSVMAISTFFITEGATMASECAMLGTPALYVNSLDAGTLREQEDKYNLIYGFRNSTGVVDKINELINTPNLKEIFFSRQQLMLADKIDVTAFLVWFIENYPQSVKIMKENPDYQFNFK